MNGLMLRQRSYAMKNKLPNRPKMGIQPKMGILPTKNQRLVLPVMKGLARPTEDPCRGPCLLVTDFKGEILSALSSDQMRPFLRYVPNFHTSWVE